MTGPRAVVVGVDTSTQSCKVLFLDATTGELVASGSAPHPVVTPPLSEQDPEAWWGAFVTAFKQARESSEEVTVRAISVAGQCHGFVPLDANGAVIRPAKLWNDTTTAHELDDLRARIGDRAFVDTIGTLPTAAFTISKIAWLASHEPENFARLAMILLPHDYLNYRLTGEYVTDRSEASGTGYFDASTNEYVFMNLAHIDSTVDWASMVPRVAEPDGRAGTVQAEVAALLGIGDDVIVGAGGGDQHATALGLGIEPGDLVYALGTSGVVFTISPEPVRDYSGTVDGVADMTGHFLPLVCTLNAAKVTDAFARLLGVDHAELSALALSAPDSNGAILVPYLDAERTPNRPNARGMLVDIASDITREQLARAAYEGVLLGLVSGHRKMNDAGILTDGSVYVVGGGARSAAYTQLLSDLLGREVLVPETNESTARGAALQAAAVLSNTPVATLRTQWKPRSFVAARPRTMARNPWPMFQAASQVTGLDPLTTGSQ